MEVLCACDRHYLPHAGTMICSLLEHNHVSRIHLFFSDIDDDELAKLQSLVEGYKSTIAFYRIVAEDLDELRVNKWYSTAIYYRLLATRLLPKELEKILYLDADIIVTRSLAELWNTNIDIRPFAAMANLEDAPRKALGLADGTGYFNSGVLLINLKYWREFAVPQNAVQFLRNNFDRVQYPDQDALNATLAGQWLELPTTWNWQPPVRKRWSKNSPAIIHFVGPQKPWHWHSKHPFKPAYRKYRKKTPWPYREEETPPPFERLDYYARSLVRKCVPSRVRLWLRAKSA